MNAVLLLSGGMDSAAVAFWCRPRFALTVNYGQVSAEAEARAARAVAGTLKLEHSVLDANLRSLGVGRMAGAAPVAASPTPEWWPYRNQLLVTLAAAHAIKVGADSVLIGTLSTDWPHADGSPEFVNRLDALLRLQEGSIRLIAPALEFDAVELVRRAGAPPALLGLTHSCHSGNVACGRCRGCAKRLETLIKLKWQ